MSKSKIEWTDKVWNPVTGCTKVSAGCKNCYAGRMAKRLAGRYGYNADDPFQVTIHPDHMGKPLRWKKPCVVFVCSMGDLFHADVPFEFIFKVYVKMQESPRHTFIVLTKRPERMSEFLNKYAPVPAMTGMKWGQDYLPKHIVHGVSVEDRATADERIPILLQTPGATRFASYEPATGPVDFTHFFSGGIDAIILGGESGPGARPMHPDWARSTRDQCANVGTMFFFKQWGEFGEGSTPYLHKHSYVVLNDGRCYTDKEWHVEKKGTDIVGRNPINISKVGKHISGRLLDGVEHNDLPWRVK